MANFFSPEDAVHVLKLIMAGRIAIKNKDGVRVTLCADWANSTQQSKGEHFVRKIFGEQRGPQHIFVWGVQHRLPRR